MADHSTLAFSTLHKAKFDAGTDASLPGSPEGVGDIFLATDTQILYIADAAGTAWVAYGLSLLEDENSLYLSLVGL